MQEYLDQLMRDVRNPGQHGHNPKEYGTMERNLSLETQAQESGAFERGGRAAFRAVAAVLTVAAVMLANGLQAASLDWNPAGGAGASGVWDQDLANWYDSADAMNVAWDNLAGDTANFPSFVGAIDVTLGEAISAGGLTLGAGTGTVTLKGEALSLNGNIIGQSTRTLLLENDVTIGGTSGNVRALAGLIDIEGVLASSAQLWSANNANVITLRNENALFRYYLRAGTLELGHNKALGTSTLFFGDSESGSLTLRAINGPRTIANNVSPSMRSPQWGVTMRTLDGDLTFTGNLSISRITSGPADTVQRFILNTVNGTSTFTGNVTSNGTATQPVRLDKQGSGTLIFQHASNSPSTAFQYGGIIVQEGTLLINSPFTDQDNYVVGGATITGNATLGGTGTISLASGNSVTVQGTPDYTATLSPGNSIGTLTINGDVIIGDYGVLSIEVSGAQSDLLVVDGDLNLSSLLNSLEIFGTLAGGEYIIASYSGSLTGEFANLPILPSGYTLDYGTGFNSFITLAIPEPTSLAMLGLGALALLKRRRA